MKTITLHSRHAYSGTPRLNAHYIDITTRSLCHSRFHIPLRTRRITSYIVNRGRHHTELRSRQTAHTSMPYDQIFVVASGVDPGGGGGGGEERLPPSPNKTSTKDHRCVFLFGYSAPSDAVAILTGSDKQYNKLDLTRHMSVESTNRRRGKAGRVGDKRGMGEGKRKEREGREA